MKMNPPMVILLCALFLLNQVVYGVDENNVTDNELNLSDASKTVCKLQYESVYNETDVKNCGGSDLIAQINGEHLLDGNQATIQNAYLANSILGNFPKFDLRLANGVSAECRTEAEIYSNDVHNMELWALRMLDSSAKLPSGFLSGNLNQMGDFDQCLGIRQQTAEGGEIRGQYCLASFQVSLKANATDLLRKLHRLVHAHYAFRSQLRDPGHRVPRYSSINWALCVPSACSHLDVAAGLEYYLDSVLGPVAGLDVDVHVAEDMCQVQSEDKGWSFGTRVTGCFILALLALVLVATLYDAHTEESKNEYLMAFSLRANHSRLMSTRRSTDDISCVHGIRLLNSLMLIVSHKCMAMYFMPFINRTPMNEELGQSWTVIGRAASLYTDPFIMFSGLLTTYSILKKLKRDGQFSMWKEYSSRLARIVPPFAFLIAFCTWILPELGSGPQWPQVISHHATICKQYWWRNMLFIHNYYGFENMCLTHTHHVGIDTQLFLVTPPAVLLLWRYPRRALQALFTVATLSTVARYAVTHYMNLSNYVFFGTSLRQLFETADNMYILPPHRATVYIMGIFLAYLLHNKQNVVLSKMQLRLGWSISTCLLLLSFLGPAPMGSINYEYRVWHAATYAAFAPVAWCGFFAWVVFVSQLGHKSVLTDMLSWGGYAVWTRISYAVYLTQFPIFFYYVGINRVPNFFSFVPQMTNMRELFAITTTSIAMTLFIDLPCQNLKNIITKNIERRLKSKQSKQQDVLLVPSVQDRLMPIRDLKCRRIGSAKQS